MENHKNNLKNMLSQKLKSKQKERKGGEGIALRYQDSINYIVLVLFVLILHSHEK